MLKNGKYQKYEKMHLDLDHYWIDQNYPSYLGGRDPADYGSKLTQAKELVRLHFNKEARDSGTYLSPQLGGRQLTGGLPSGHPGQN
jgi:hypothetical protein